MSVIVPLPIGSVGTSALADGAVTSSKVAAGIPVQIVSTNYNAVATGTTQIPFDDTIPQITEGTQFMSQAITPKSSTNTLVIEITACLNNNNGAGSNMIMALFQDSNANAVAVTEHYDSSVGWRTVMTLRHKMVAGTTSSTTFTMRAGASQSGTTTFSGSAGGRAFGGATMSNITITEYKS